MLYMCLLEVGFLTIILYSVTQNFQVLCSLSPDRRHYTNANSIKKIRTHTINNKPVRKHKHCGKRIGKFVTPSQARVSSIEYDDKAMDVINSLENKDVNLTSDNYASFVNFFRKKGEAEKGSNLRVVSAAVGCCSLKPGPLNRNVSHAVKYIVSDGLLMEHVDGGGVEEEQEAMEKSSAHPVCATCGGKNKTTTQAPVTDADYACPPSKGYVRSGQEQHPVCATCGGKNKTTPKTTDRPTAKRPALSGSPDDAAVVGEPKAPDKISIEINPNGKKKEYDEQLKKNIEAILKQDSKTFDEIRVNYIDLRKLNNDLKNETKHIHCSVKKVTAFSDDRYSSVQPLPLPLPLPLPPHPSHANPSAYQKQLQATSTAAAVGAVQGTDAAQPSFQTTCVPVLAPATSPANVVPNTTPVPTQDPPFKPNPPQPPADPPKGCCQINNIQIDLNVKDDMTIKGNIKLDYAKEKSGEYTTVLS